MKFAALLAALTLSAFPHPASAAPDQACINEVVQNCANELPWQFLVSLDNLDSCKVAITKDVRNVAFLSAGGFQLTSVSVKDCRVSQYNLQSGRIVDTKVLDGRLYAAVSSGRVMVLGRNNAIYELNKSKNKPYSDVTGLAVAPYNLGIVLKRARNQTTRVYNFDLQSRIDQNQLSVLALPQILR